MGDFYGAFHQQQQHQQPPPPLHHSQSSDYHQTGSQYSAPGFGYGSDSYGQPGQNSQQQAQQRQQQASTSGSNANPYWSHPGHNHSAAGADHHQGQQQQNAGSGNQFGQYANGSSTPSSNSTQGYGGMAYDVMSGNQYSATYSDMSSSYPASAQQQHYYSHPDASTSHQQQQQQGMDDQRRPSLSPMQLQQQHSHQQQQHLQRASTDQFGPVSAGPPSPGKMDMLPFGNSRQDSYSAQKQKGREQPEPLPSGLTKGLSTKGSSTTSEFTKRKNWSQRIVEEMIDVLHVLSPSGVFLFTSPSVHELTGYTPSELVGRNISDLIERDDVDNFIKDFTASIQSDTPMRTYFRFKRKDDKSILFEVTGQPYYTNSPGPVPSRKNTVSIDNADAGTKTCKCFFAMARQYPSKNNAMLDSFLELKIENEKLRQKLAEMYREIEGDPEDLSGIMEVVGDRQISGFPHRAQGQGTDDNASSASSGGLFFGHTSLGPGMYGQGQAGQGYADPSHIQRGAPLGQDGVLVSSAGLIPSTSNTYGALGIGISSAANARAQGQDGGDLDADGKKKKPKKARTEEGEFVCRDCGTVDSPEWRRGPQGPKTLCNAVSRVAERDEYSLMKLIQCGLRWAKKNKQQRASISQGDGGGLPAMS